MGIPQLLAKGLFLNFKLWLVLLHAVFQFRQLPLHLLLDLTLLQVLLLLPVHQFVFLALQLLLCILQLILQSLAVQVQLPQHLIVLVRLTMEFHNNLLRLLAPLLLKTNFILKLLQDPLQLVVLCFLLVQLNQQLSLKLLILLSRLLIGSNFEFVVVQLFNFHFEWFALNFILLVLLQHTLQVIPRLHCLLDDFLVRHFYVWQL